MKNDMGKDEVGKCSFWTDATELILVERIHLHSQTHWHMHCIMFSTD